MEASMCNLHVLSEIIALDSCAGACHHRGAPPDTLVAETARSVPTPRLEQEITMMHLIADSLVMVALATAGLSHPDRWHSLPLDTTVAVASASTLWLDLKTGGAVRIIEGATGIVRIRANARTRVDADCNTLLTRSDTAIRFTTERPEPGSPLAALQIEIEVPKHYNIVLSSAGGDVEIDGIDGSVSGTTHHGALRLRRLSGAVTLQTGRGDVTLRESYLSGTIRTLDGRVHMEDVMGTVQAVTEKGTVIKRRVETIAPST
jgi:hypothetical protein